jgi:hypothetical protein
MGRSIALQFPRNQPEAALRDFSFQRKKVANVTIAQFFVTNPFLYSLPEFPNPPAESLLPAELFSAGDKSRDRGQKIMMPA